MKKCINKYCPIKYDPESKVCKDCKFNKDIEIDMPEGWDEIFGLGKKGK